MKKKLIALALCLVLCLGVLPLGTLAADGAVSYLALGDSISTGFGLSDRSRGFAGLLAEEWNATLTNEAVDGHTSTNLLAKLKTGSLDRAIAAADVITITIGGNDITHAIYQVMADIYNSQVGGDKTVQEIIQDIGEGDVAVLLPIMMAMNNITGTAAFQAALDTYEVNMFGTDGALDYIRDRNSDAEIILLLQYDPYQSYASSSMLSTLYTSIDPAMVALNEVISQNARSGGYMVSDVYTAFRTDTRNLCNADPATMNLDVHPNAEGHAVIAETVRRTLASEHTAHREGSPATCANAAVCLLCGEEYGEPLGHRMTKTEAKTETCTEEGNRAYYTCGVCHGVFMDEQGKAATTVEAETLPTKAHIYAEIQKEEAKLSPATCTSGALYGKSCAVCGEVGEETFAGGEALGHRYDWGVCSVCGEEDPNYVDLTWLWITLVALVFMGGFGAAAYLVVKKKMKETEQN